MNLSTECCDATTLRSSRAALAHMGLDSKSRILQILRHTAAAAWPWPAAATRKHTCKGLAVPYYCSTNWHKCFWRGCETNSVTGCEPAERDAGVHDLCRAAPIFQTKPGPVSDLWPSLLPTPLRTSADQLSQRDQRQPMCEPCLLVSSLGRYAMQPCKPALDRMQRFTLHVEQGNALHVQSWPFGARLLSAQLQPAAHLHHVTSLTVTLSLPQR